MSGIFIRNLRKKKGITQVELSEILGISIEKLRKIERGNESIKLKYLPKLAETFGEENVYVMVISELNGKRV